MCLILQVTLNTEDFRNNGMKLQQYISLRKLLQPIAELPHLLIVTLITLILRTTHTVNFKKLSCYYEPPLQIYLLSFLSDHRGILEVIPDINYPTLGT